MEIITERHKCPGMIIPSSESEGSIRDEANKRTCKAGYTDSDGQPKRSRSTGAGKGDVCRPCNMNKYRENYARIFGHD